LTFTPHLNSPLRETVDDGCSYLNQRVGVSGRVFPEYAALHLQLAAAHSPLKAEPHESQMSPSKLNRKRIFTPSDDALIRQQPFTGMGLKTLETMLRTNREASCAVPRNSAFRSSSINDHDEAIDTRTLRCTDGPVDPLLQRLKQTHGDRK
jgi:hypothetical protein